MDLALATGLRLCLHGCRGHSLSNESVATFLFGFCSQADFFDERTAGIDSGSFRQVFLESCMNKGLGSMGLCRPVALVGGKDGLLRAAEGIVIDLHLGWRQ